MNRWSAVTTQRYYLPLIRRVVLPIPLGESPAHHRVDPLPNLPSRFSRHMQNRRKYRQTWAVVTLSTLTSPKGPANRPKLDRHNSALRRPVLQLAE